MPSGKGGGREGGGREGGRKSTRGRGGYERGAFSPGGCSIPHRPGRARRLRLDNGRPGVPLLGGFLFLFFFSLRAYKKIIKKS